jgi:hypothetical protein
MGCNFGRYCRVIYCSNILSNGGLWTPLPHLQGNVFLCTIIERCKWTAFHWSFLFDQSYAWSQLSLDSCNQGGILVASNWSATHVNAKCGQPMPPLCMMRRRNPDQSVPNCSYLYYQFFETVHTRRHLRGLDRSTKKRCIKECCKLRLIWWTGTTQWHRSVAHWLASTRDVNITVAWQTGLSPLVQLGQAVPFVLSYQQTSASSGVITPTIFEDDHCMTR